MAMRVAQLGVSLAMLLACAGACAQQAPTGTTPPRRPAAATSQTTTKIGDSVQTEAPTLPQVPGQELDRAVAIVNGELILDSDVDQERRFQALLPYGESGREFTRERAVERLINRSLILQQARQQPDDSVADSDVTKDIADLRKTIPGCKVVDCQSDAEWKKFLQSKGFSEEGFFKLWKQRMQVLAFIQERFQLGIKITPEQVKSYYETKMLPVYAEKGVKAPPLEAISSRIQDVLLQQQVSGLLNDWLNSLRSQGSIVVLHPGEGAP
jgi:peptidyl-prolyl cis-trans isomerase SurA